MSLLLYGREFGWLIVAVACDILDLVLPARKRFLLQKGKGSLVEGGPEKGGRDADGGGVASRYCVVGWALLELYRQHLCWDLFC